MTFTATPTRGTDLRVSQTIAVGVGRSARYTITSLVFQRPPRPRGVDGRPLSGDSLGRLSYLTIRAVVVDERGRESTMPIHRVREYDVLNPTAV